MDTKRKKDDWIELDNLQNGILSLELAVEYMGRISINLHYWKWVIIGIHNCLQSFMVLALRGSTPMNILSERNAEKWLKAYPEQVNSNSYKLDCFLNLYKKIKTERMLIFENSKKFIPTGNDDKYINTLNEYRNSLIHFEVDRWSISILGIKEMALDILSIIEFLAFKSENLLWPDDKTKEELQKLLSQGRKNLAKI